MEIGEYTVKLAKFERIDHDELSGKCRMPSRLVDYHLSSNKRRINNSAMLLDGCKTYSFFYQDIVFCIMRGRIGMNKTKRGLEGNTED